MKTKHDLPIPHQCSGTETSRDREADNKLETCILCDPVGTNDLVVGAWATTSLTSFGRVHLTVDVKPRSHDAAHMADDLQTQNCSYAGSASLNSVAYDKGLANIAYQCHHS